MHSRFSPLTQIVRGTHASASTLIDDEQGEGKRVSQTVKSLAPHVEMARETMCVALRYSSVTNMGFPQGASWAELDQCLSSLRCEPCAAEDGLQLWCLKLSPFIFKEGPLHLMMPSMKDEKGQLLRFIVDYIGNALWINTVDGNPRFLLKAADRVVFL